MIRAHDGVPFKPQIPVRRTVEIRPFSFDSNHLEEKKIKLLQERGPLPGPETGLLTLGNELSEETHVLTKQEILLGKGTRVVIFIYIFSSFILDKVLSTQ